MAASFANDFIDKTYGGVSRRLAAYSLDCLFLLIGLVVLQVALFVVNPIIAMLRRGQQPTPTQMHLWVFVTATIPFLLYFALMLRSSRQATVGMRLFKLKVEDKNGGMIGLGQALLRSVVMLIPFELNHTFMFHLGPRGGPPSVGFFISIVAVWAVISVYIASMLWTQRHQSVHDLVAGTVVYQLSRNSQS
jgi:uncharacterized RDD family membrane protein YckC